MTIEKEWIESSIKAAVEASKVIMAVYEQDFSVDLKSDRSPVTAADKGSSSVITAPICVSDFPTIACLPSDSHTRNCLSQTQTTLAQF